MPSRSEPCACGGVVTVRSVGPEPRRLAAFLAMTEHRRTPQHLAWSGYQDIQRGPLERPTVTAAAEAIALARTLELEDVPESELRLLDGNR